MRDKRNKCRFISLSERKYLQVTEGTYEFKMNEYRRIRDEINDKFFKLYCDMEERKK